MASWSRRRFGESSCEKRPKETLYNQDLLNRQSLHWQLDAYRLNQDYSVESIDGLPRASNVQSYIGRAGLEKRRVQVMLDVDRGWTRGFHVAVLSSASPRTRILAGMEEIRERRNVYSRTSQHFRGRFVLAALLRTPNHSSFMAYAQPHPRLSVLSTSSLSSVEHLSPTTSSTRFSLPSAPSINVSLGTKPSAPRPNIYDRNLNKTRQSEVSASAFSFLFSEVVQYTQKRVNGINDLERRYVWLHLT